MQLGVSPPMPPGPFAFPPHMVHMRGGHSTVGAPSPAVHHSTVAVPSHYPVPSAHTSAGMAPHYRFTTAPTDAVTITSDMASTYTSSGGGISGGGVPPATHTDRSVAGGYATAPVQRRDTDRPASVSASSFECVDSGDAAHGQWSWLSEVVAGSGCDVDENPCLLSKDRPVCATASYLSTIRGGSAESDAVSAYGSVTSTGQSPAAFEHESSFLLPSQLLL